VFIAFDAESASPRTASKAASVAEAYDQRKDKLGSITKQGNPLLALAARRACDGHHPPRATGWDAETPRLARGSFDDWAKNVTQFR
jgi:hypothetical protein